MLNDPVLKSGRSSHLPITVDCQLSTISQPVRLALLLPILLKLLNQADRALSHNIPFLSPARNQRPAPADISIGGDVQIMDEPVVIPFLTDSRTTTVNWIRTLLVNAGYTAVEAREIANKYRGCRFRTLVGDSIGTCHDTFGELAGNIIFNEIREHVSIQLSFPKIAVLTLPESRN